MGVLAGLLRAQEPSPAPLPAAAPVQAVTPGEILGMDAVPMAQSAANKPSRWSRIKGWLQQKDCCCADHHNCLGCTNGKADCKFIFGSCHTFFSEPCTPGPSPYRTKMLLAEGPYCNCK
jgi:hypothetical protein